MNLYRYGEKAAIVLFRAAFIGFLTVGVYHGAKGLLELIERWSA